MRKNIKLILVEGLCGTGKSTLAERLHRYALQQGFSSHFFDEGAKNHPASLNWHAFFREKEYEDLLKRYQDTADLLRSCAIKGDGCYLVPYRGVKEFDDLISLKTELKRRDLCWTDAPVATISEFTHSIQGQWGRFVEKAISSKEIYILEAVFFQHQIHDMLGHYQADDHQIENHIQGITDRIAALNPVLIYLTQQSVREQQVWISSIRAKPQFATEQNISFMENRKRIEMMLLDRLSFPNYQIENENQDWEDIFCKMVGAIS